MNYELISAAKQGDEAAFSELAEIYLPLINAMSERYHALSGGGAEADDLRQEASVAFYHAILSFDCAQKNVTFGLYAKICIRNRLVSILRKIKTEKKHKIGQNEPQSASDTRYEKLGKLSEVAELAEKLLTKLEKQIFYMYLEGMSYKDIALSLGKTEKSVDNALFRAKAKLRNRCSM